MTYEEQAAAAEAISDGGDWQRALKLADSLIAKEPARPEAHLARGRALALGGQLELSAAAYEKAYALGDRSPRLYAELTGVDDVLGRYPEAERLYREYLAVAPDDVAMRQQLSLTLMLENQPQKAAEELEKLHDPTLSSPEKLDVATDYALALYAAGRLDEAKELATRVLDKDPKRAAAHRVLAEIAAKRGDLGLARDHVDEAVQIDPEEPSARRLRAQLRLALGNFAGAVDDYGTLWRQGYRDGGILLGLAGGLILTGQLDQAEEALARVRNMNVTSPTLALREAQLRRRRGERRALDDIEAFAKAHPKSIDVWQELLAAGRERKDPVLTERARAALAGLGVAVTK